MTNELALTKEQRIAYDRFIKARNKVYRGSKWVRPSDIEGCVDVEGLNHPVFIVNDAYAEYVNALQAWLDIEPKFRNEERMRATRGDYGAADSWEDKQTKRREL